MVFFSSIDDYQLISLKAEDELPEPMFLTSGVSRIVFQSLNGPDTTSPSPLPKYIEDQTTEVVGSSMAKSIEESQYGHETPHAVSSLKMITRCKDIGH